MNLQRLLTLIALGLAVCGSSVAHAHDTKQPAACHDTTPHKVQFITVAPNVSVEVVDWGGNGEAMLLLTGLGDNAHIFDGFAFQFTDRFHVIGITRRGYLPSSQPQDGYDIATRVADDIAVLDALAIRRAIWVGHSISGSELSAAGLLYGDRVDRLVYLDAYDLSQRSQVPGPPDSSSLYTDADVQSIMVYQAAIARYEAVRRPVPATCFGVVFDQAGRLTGPSTPDLVAPAIMASVNTASRVLWANIVAPRLGIFARPTVQSHGLTPWYFYLSAANQQLFDEQYPAVVDWFHRTINQFAANNPVKPLILPNVPHYVFLNNEADVVRAMRTFLE